MLRIWFAMLSGCAMVVVCALSSTAYAGCVGAGIGDGCIGIPTPERRYEHHRDHLIIEHHHRHPVIIEHHHDEDDDDE